MNYIETIWNGFRRLDFTFEGREAILVCPPTSGEEAAGSGSHWMLKTEYFDAFPDLELELVRRGYYLAYIKNINRWGLPEDLHAKKRFRDFLVKEFGLNEKCIPIGMSCGGLFGIKLAGLYPEMVSVLYVDAPVVNILSMLDMGTPENVCTIRAEEIYEALGKNRSEMISYRDHPLDYLPKLVAERIPVCLVYGGADTVVLPGENAELIKKAYSETDIPFLWFMKEGLNHHPHALQGLSPDEQSQVIEFLLDLDQKQQNVDEVEVAAARPLETNMAYTNLSEASKANPSGALDFEAMQNLQIPDREFFELTRFANWADNGPDDQRRGEMLGFTGRKVLVAPGAIIRIPREQVGDNVFIGLYTYLNGNVTVGNNVLIGPHCSLPAGNHKFDPATGWFSARSEGDGDDSIVVGDGCWLASHVTVTAGVKLGRANLICAGSVVTKSTPDYAIMAGAPPRQIDRIDPQTGEYIWFSKQKK